MLKDVKRFKKNYMLVAKLSKELIIPVAISPVKSEDRKVNSFYVEPIQYVLGATIVNFYIKMTEEKIVPKNPASQVQGEGDTKKVYELKKVFNATLSGEDLQRWDSNDENLLRIFAEKYDLEIASFEMAEISS